MVRLPIRPTAVATAAALFTAGALAEARLGAAAAAPTVRSVGFSVQVAGAGKRLTVRDVVRGRGGRLTYFLSRDRKRTRDDRRLGGRRVGASRGRTRVRIPRSMRIGAYRVLACAGKRGRCRASGKRLVVTGLPRPLRVSPRLASGSAVSQDIGRGGGTVSTTAADGTSFTLTIPDGALLDPAKVTLTPIGAVGRLPLRGGRMLGAVQVDPAGTRLLKPATLTIRSSRRARRGRLTGFAFAPGGRQFHLTPAAAAGGVTSLKVFELKGYGAGQATAAARYRLSRTRLPSASLNQLQQVAAAPRAPRRGARRAQAGPVDEISAQIFASYIFLTTLVRSNLDQAFLQYPAWEAISIGFSGRYPQVILWREQLKQEFRLELERELAKARFACLSARDVTSIARVVRYRTYLVTLVQLGLGNFQSRVDQLLDQCLRFELDYQVGIDGTNGNSEAVNAGVKSTIPVRMQGPGALNSFYGSAPLQVTSYSTGPIDCWTHTWNVTPQRPVTISPMKVDIPLTPGLERAPPLIEVNFDLGALDEQVTHTCDGDPSSSYTDQQHAYDGVTAALLGGESGQSFTLRWQGGSGGSYASQTFTRSGAGSDGGNYSGTLSFSLRHTPAP